MPDGHAEFSKSTQAAELGRKLPGDAATGEAGVHDLVATDRAAELGTVEHHEHRRLAGHGLNSTAPFGGTIAGAEHQPAATVPEPVRDLVEADHELTGATREADPVETAAHQQPLDLFDQIDRCADRRTRGLGKLVAGQGPARGSRGPSSPKAHAPADVH